MHEEDFTEPTYTAEERFRNNTVNLLFGYVLLLGHQL